MTGFAYDSSPVDAKDRQAWLPSDRQLRYAVGTQYQWSERLSLGGNVEDHTEFMVLALQFYDVYRESILGFASKKALAGEHIALVYPTLVST